MPIQTNLNVSPYFDDYDQTKDFYEILFKPGVALQTRELNQLQTILQRQIERFGDNIFMKGTIINGCNFTYNNAYPYAKLLDLQIDGQPTVVGAYVNLRAVNGSNLVSTVLGANVGYVSQAPDLNTLFLQYLNSGDTYNQTSYSENDILTIHDANNTIFQVNVPVGGAGAGFSNNDTLVFMSAITVPSGITVGVGNTVNDLVSLANATVVSVNTTAISNTIVLGLAPYANALTNNSLTSAAWTFNTGNAVHINGTIPTTITSIVGSGATGKIITNALGAITQVAMLTSGDGYTVSPGGASTFAPYVTVKTTNTTTSVTSLGLTAQNYLAQVTVANNLVSGVSNATGLGYSFSVSEGVVYQKGYFLYVAPQSLVVSKYSTTPDQISIGFKTDESIIDSDFDSSLLDNSTGTFNALAPGADRLKLVPNLTAVATSDAVGNSDFFAITAFSLGLPYLQNQQTAYSAINEEMALRTYETNGDFVIDPFLLNTTTPKNASATTESTYFTAVVDPGEAYISGNRVKTYTNYSINVRQGTDTQVVNAVSVFLNYDNSIVVNDVGGLFNLTTGDYVTFYDTKKAYLSGTAWATINTSPAGNPIGTARIRSMQLLSGTPGTPAAQYKLYLYDINMNAGVNFRSANSIYFSNSTSSAIADIVLTYDAAANANVAIIANNTSTVLFNHGANGTANTNNSSYIYRDIFPLTTNGVIQFTLSNTFPYNVGTNLTNSQLNELQVVFTANASSVNVSDVIFVTNGSNTVVANTTAFSNANFTTSYAAGDYIQVFKTGGTSDIKRISSVINATALQVDTNWGSSSNGISNLSIYFPQNIQTPLANRSNRYANLNGAGTQLTIDLGVKLTSLTAPVSVMYNGVSTASPTPKTARRNTSVVIVPSTNPGDLTGPWALGHPDIFRLRKVYRDTITNVINTASNVAMITLNSNSISGTFSSGEMVYQYSGQTNLAIGTISGGGSFTAGELVYQTVGSNTLFGTVFFVGSGYLVVNTDPGSPAEFVTSQTIVKNSSPTTANASVTAVTHFTTNIGVITAIYSNYKTIINNVQIGNVTSFEVRTNNTSPVATIYNNSYLWGLTSSANGLVLTSSSAANNQTVVSSLPATAVDVTNEFYINHNQNLDFYDQGFLYKNPKSLLNVDSNTALIAYFDHFTTSTSGFYTKSSYPVDDTKTFAELTTTATTVINTLEIPELTTQTGNTYDLIDQVDFRPSVIATANITNGVLASSSINPIIAPANVKFSTASTMKFPVPGSKYTSDITQYAGRIDRVVIDNSNDIKVISGRAELNNLKAPNLPANTLSINLMNIPPYPSLPSVLSDNQISILDKNILSEGVNEKRVVNHTIGVPKLTPQQQEISQPVRYTMSDIANLEARIKALEYYVALSQLEKSVTNVAIPSNVNASINRFKYGFFADNFDSTSYTDLKNTQLTTIIDDNQEVVPGKFMKNISVDVNLSDVATANCVTGSLITLPYRYSNGFASVLNLINQNVATVTDWSGTASPIYDGRMTSTPKTFTIETKVLVANTSPPKAPYTTLLGEVGTASTSVVTGGYMLGLFGMPMSTPTVTTKYATQWGGSAKTFIVPDGVYSILVYAWGAGGGGGGGGNQNTTWGVAGGAGGGGGFVKAYVKVTPGQKIEAFAGTGGGGGGVSNGSTGLSPAGYSSIPGATRQAVIQSATGGGGGGGAASGIIINGTLVLYAGGGGGGAGASFHQGSIRGNPGGTGGGGTNYAEWDPNNFTYNGGGGGNRNGVGGTGSSSPNYVNLTYVTSILNNVVGLNGVIPDGGASRGTTQPYFMQKLGAGGDSVQKNNGLPGYHGKVAILY